MKELADDPSLRASGTIVEVDHKVRGKYLTVGSPIKFSDLKVEVTGSPCLASTPTKSYPNWATPRIVSCSFTR